MCESQDLDDLSYRRRLRRGETVDGCDLFIHQSENLQSVRQAALNQAGRLSRSHTIHQDLTHSSPEDLEHTPSAVKMDNSEANGHPTNLSPEPEQVIGKADNTTQASLEEEEEQQQEEEDQNWGKNLHWVSTEMDNIML